MPKNKSGELTYPAWFNGPKGESAVFESADDVPTGWTSGAEKRTAKEPDKEPDKAPAKKAGRPKKDQPLDL